jgi:ectoine hydroxylase-related dioxygenase (phytanoyl-CoA dioxygenase family)
MIAAMKTLADDCLDRCVGEREVAAFARDGAVCLRGILSPDQVATLARGIDANLAAPSPRAIVASRHDPGFFIEDFCNWQTNDDYRRVIFDTVLAQAAGRLMRSDTVRLYHDHMLTKEPGTRQRTPWHQDQPYYNIDGMQNVSMWIPVDAVRRYSSLEFVAGSHLGPWLMPRTFMDHQAKWFPDGSLAELPDIEGTRAQRGIDTSPAGPLPPRSLPPEGAGRASERPGARPGDIIGWEVEPGDVVCFHMLALHAAGPVDADRRRRVFSVRFLGDDIRHAPRSWKTSPEFPGLIDQLPAGAPMDHALFPLLWSRAA